MKSRTTTDTLIDGGSSGVGAPVGVRVGAFVGFGVGTDVRAAVGKPVGEEPDKQILPTPSQFVRVQVTHGL